MPRGEADEAAARLRLIEPAVEIGKKIGSGVARARARHFLVAEIEQGVAVATATVRPADDGVDKPLECACGSGTRVRQNELARPWPEDRRGYRAVRRRRPAGELIQPPCSGNDAEQVFVGRAEAESHRRAIGVTGGHRRSGLEPGFGRRLFGHRAGDGKGLEYVAKKPRVSA